MFFRRVQIMLMALIAISALEQSARQPESLEVVLDAKRLAKTQAQALLVLTPDRASSSIALVSKKPNRLAKKNSSPRSIVAMP